MQARFVFYGWNNLTEFEEQNIAKTKQFLIEKLNCQIPEEFNDREILKFAQAYDFNVAKAAAGLQKHFIWYNRFLSNAVMTPPALRLI